MPGVQAQVLLCYRRVFESCEIDEDLFLLFEGLIQQDVVTISGQSLHVFFRVW